MKILKVTIITLISIIALVVIISFFFPSKVHVSRSIVVNASAKTVFDQVNRLKNWQRWGGPWQVNTNVKLSFKGEEGVGSILFYDHEVSGKGNVAIIESVPSKSLKTEITFSDQGKANGIWKFEEGDKGTKVTWRININLGMNPIKKIVGGLMMDGKVGPEFEQGLAKLKNVAEGG